MDVKNNELCFTLAYVCFLCTQAAASGIACILCMNIYFVPMTALVKNKYVKNFRRMHILNLPYYSETPISYYIVMLRSLCQHKHISLQNICIAIIAMCIRSKYIRGIFALNETRLLIRVNKTLTVSQFHTTYCKQ